MLYRYNLLLMALFFVRGDFLLFQFLKTEENPHVQLMN